jgi:hypothetical protein
MEFRTKYNPGTFSDNEVYKEGTSLTEPCQAESMQDLVARLDKAELAARVARNRRFVGDATKLSDDAVDQLMDDASLDDAETEKTEMAEVVESSLATEESLAGVGANSVSGSENEQSEANANLSGTQTANSQPPATAFATQSQESPRE